MEFNRSLSQHLDGAKKSMEKTTQSSKPSAPDSVQLSSRATPENPGLSGGMKSSDRRASTSDGSRPKSEELLLEMMAELRNLRKDLKELANETMRKWVLDNIKR